MKTHPFSYEILMVLLLSVIPWPGPSVFKISCPRDRASVVRRIVQRRWIPILKKYQVELPLECPFHASRDIFYPQEAAKHQHRSSQWTCGLCGKSFYTEKHLDAHFDNRHRSVVNTAEDAVCLADYCDIMRCDVLGYHDFESYELDGSSSTNTDLQVWKESTEYKTSVAPCESHDVARSYVSSDAGSPTSSISLGRRLHRFCQQRNIAISSKSYRGGRREIAGPDNKSRACDKSDDNEEEEADDEKASSVSSEEREDEEEEDEDDEEEAPGNLVESALPATGKNRCGRNAELRWLKSNCKPEELQKLKIQCEILIRDCIAGLLANLSLRDFQEVESELNRAICWHLSCDRYWEDSRRPHRYIPWYLLMTFLMLLSASLYGCYYVVWVFFNSEEGKSEIDTKNVDFNHGTEHHGKHFHEVHGSMRHFDDRRVKRDVGDASLDFNEEAPDPYIYVAYPPELKQRLLESCYNRTTRL